MAKIFHIVFLGNAIFQIPELCIYWIYLLWLLDVKAYFPLSSSSGRPLARAHLTEVSPSFVPFLASQRADLKEMVNCAHVLVGRMHPVLLDMCILAVTIGNKFHVHDSKCLG